jgi:hypothetical protein
MPVTETKTLDEAAQADSSQGGLESLSLDNNFTPSTPYVHKFRTEMCKNFMMYGKCKYGDEVSKQFKFKSKSSDSILRAFPNYSNLNYS